MAQDVFSKMAEEQWILNEDGYLNVDTDVKEILYHPYLNVILISTKSGVVKVLDVNSGVILQSSYLSAQNLNEVKCKYIPSLDRVLFTDGQALGVRSDYNGVLLLDSVLQKTVSDGKEEVKLELPLSEAIILKESLYGNATGVDHIINELTDVITNAQKDPKKGIKAQKWNTVCLTLPLEDLRSAAANTVSNLLSKCQHIPELGVASAVQERLSDLLGEKVNASDRKSMASEWRRRETYSQWPHMDYKWALPDQMAQAGFYHQPNSSGDDRAMCFTCNVCLVCWERTDEPCSEHERHSPGCPFVVGEYTQNVPLSVTYATGAAVDATYRGLGINVIGNSAVARLVPTASSDGLVSVFDVGGKVRRAHSFYVTQFDSFILDKFTRDFGQAGVWTTVNGKKKYPVEKRITALCIVSDEQFNTKPPRPTLICGLNLTCQSEKILQITPDLMETEKIIDTKIYLVVYDFLYSKELEETENEMNFENTLSTFMPDDKISQSVSDEKLTNIFSNLDPIELETEELPGYNLMKQLSSFYKTLIPGESDEVFLPPSMGQKKSHTGPRLLMFDEFNNTKTDSSSSSHPLTNGQLSSLDSDLSISDHIAEVKNNQSSKKLNYSRAVQCVSLPDECSACCDLEVSDIVTTLDQTHVLVVLKNCFATRAFLVVYALDCTDKMVKLKEEPALVKELAGHETPIEVTLLPSDYKAGVGVEGKCDARGDVVMVCVDGVVRIVNLSSLNTVCCAKIEGEGFVSAVYCNSLDRLCASTEKGSLHFFALNNADNESSDDHEDDDPFGMNVDVSTSSATPQQQQLDNLDNADLVRYFQKPPDVVSLSDLKNFKSLCDFEPLKSGYCVVVPPCWSEFQQSLRQRRQPHASKGEGEQNTKTWRLLTDTTTWDEHIFEITLPNSTLLGHVDVHFTLHPNVSYPFVEITLLRQNKSGIGHKRDVKFAVDETVTIDMLRGVENPVISQEYLRAHNADILAGPIDISSYLDLSDKSGIVTLTSPKMYKTKVRNLLLHVRAVSAKEDVAAGKAKQSSDRKSEHSARKTDYYMGCDVIHELGVTLHTVKAAALHNERTQRGLMLDSDVFAQSLLLTAASDASVEALGLVLDILDWIACIRLSRNRSNNGEAPAQQSEFVGLVEESLPMLLHRCLVLGRRSLAHKCVRLIITLCSGAENINAAVGERFSSSVLSSIFSELDYISDIKSAAGLQWLFCLLLKVTSKDKESLIAAECTALLARISNELVNRANPYHLLLRGRYGLYGTPMEPELFDIGPPPYLKSDSSTTYLAGSGGTGTQEGTAEPSSPHPSGTAGGSYNKETISPKEVLSTSTTKMKFKNIASYRLQSWGLIETQPLHFTCVSASEGTRVERADANATASYINSLLPIAFGGSGGGGGSGVVEALGDKKENLEKFMTIHVDKLFKSGQKVAAAAVATAVKHQQQGFSASTNDVGYNKWVWDMLQDGDPVDVDAENLSDAIFMKFSKQMDDINAPTYLKPSSTQPEDVVSITNTTCVLPWQQMLTVPPKQVIVVERMQSGARRHVTLDFGKPILLTDVFIPSCSDLVTVTVDIWLRGDEVDETRLVLAMDIGTRNLLLTDLQPPPLCRYMKITVVGRYGMSTIRSRIPLGYFYGHIIVLPEEIPAELSSLSSSLACTDLDKQLGILSKLFEDISCRYSLSCSKLKELLQPFLVVDMRNAMHLAAYMNILKDKNASSTNVEYSKILGAYQETVRHQHQLNIIRNVIARIEGSISGREQQQTQSTEISTDKLTSIAEGLLEVLLSIEATTDISREMCQQFFQGLCMTQPPRLQLLAAIFLEKHCGRLPFWGDFLADTLATNFSTSCTLKFPQDRLFILLSYLSRKSSEKSAIIDASLRVVYDTLRPLTNNRKSLLAVSVDLPLLSWQLMYLSLQLSLCKGPAGSANRWNWVLGEMVGCKNVDNSKGAAARKRTKRIAQTCNNAIQNYQSYSSVVINSDPQNYQQKLKNIMVQDKLSRLKYMKKLQEEERLAKERKEQPVEKNVVAMKMPQCIDNVHCLAVAKGLLQLILFMDHSSSADMMLLCFKVISKLVTLANLKLGQLLKENQLLELINFCISCKIPWAPFALSCFLQDAMELTKSRTDDVEMEVEMAPSASWPPKTVTPAEVVDTVIHHFNMDESIVDQIAKQAKTGGGSGGGSSSSSSIMNNNNFPPLPSVYESEDSDFEEMLEDLQKVRCTTAASAKTTKTVAAAAASSSGLSCAVDSRLELGVQSNSEITLKKLVVKNSQLLLQNITAEGGQKEAAKSLNAWPVPVEAFSPESSLGNQHMLAYCFRSLFENLQNRDPATIESVLQLWLTLNASSKNEQFVPGTIPQISLAYGSVNDLIKTMAWTPGLSLTTWLSALQTLTLVCNVNNGKKWFDLSGMANTIVNHPDFVQLFLSLLSGSGSVPHGNMAGPSLCKALHDFLVRLQMRCDIVSPASKLGNSLKTSLLKVIYQLAQPSGAMGSKLGPYDAQCKLLQTMLYLDFVNTDLSIAMSTLESTASLVHSYVLNSDHIKCLSVSEKHSMNLAFNDLFASVLGADSIKQDRPVTYHDLLILMLKLLGKLVQTPLPDQQEVMDTESPATSQTDESKAEQIQQENAHTSSTSTACFADIVLQHHATFIRLCRCLAACKSSTYCSLPNVPQKMSISNLGDPYTVGDAVFQLLALLAKKASDKDLLLQPLLMFLAQAPQLSEPLVWFVLQVLDSEDAIKRFFAAGGITILGTSIVNSSNSPSTLSKAGTISTVMQHFSGMRASSSSSTSSSSEANSSAASKKLSSYSSSSSTTEGRPSTLLNFAPFCSISCESSTAQPADVLVQGVAAAATHRRARTPLWSYHFYPEESHTELLLQLPSAVLLSEVSLQPHSGGLVTCPSFVSLEISAHGPSRLSPVCLPLATSGLTYIRLILPTPKVANCVLIRLYKPRDANNIGLLQIRVLGTYAFGAQSSTSAAADSAEDEAHRRHGLGWLRLLHRCFAGTADRDLRRQIVEQASRVPDLLTSCCGLLLASSHVLPVYRPCLEKVLRELTLHSPENGFEAVRVLLDSRSGAIEPLSDSWQERSINVSGYQSACELLYKICEHQDEHTSYRVRILLEWLETNANHAILTGNTDSCNPAYISSIASILWSAKQSQVRYDLKSLVTVDIFNAIYNLKMQTQCSISLERSLDSLLCSVCYIRPEYFPLLLQKIGVLVPNVCTGPQASISDDRKDSESMTDDSKRGFEADSEWYGRLVIGDLSTLNLTKRQLESIALVSRSPSAVQQLLDSGLPKLLNGAILEFCRSEDEATAPPMSKLENVSGILQFFTDVSDERLMRDWLGSEDGSSFWPHLLQFLCRKPPVKSSNLQSEAHVHLEEVCVKFLSKCCLCHATNQARLAKVLCDVIYLQSNGISGFMRRLILQLLLENEKIPVSIEANETLYKSSKLAQSYVPAHPAVKQTHNRVLLNLSTNTTLLEILEQHVFFNASFSKVESLLGKKTSSIASKKDIFKTWFAVEEQEMSVAAAAGATAKDKRAKDAKNQLYAAAAAATPQSKKKRYAAAAASASTESSGVSAQASADTRDAVDGRAIKCDTVSDQPLPLAVNLGQLVRLIESKGASVDWPYVHLKIYQCKNNEDKTSSDTNGSMFQQQPPICSALQVFSSMGGLALLAQHLPTVYPETVRPTPQEKSADQSDSEWIKVEECDDIYEDILEDMGTNHSTSKSSVVISHVPPHSLTAFGLFLRLPGYAEVLLKETKKALFLLRLVLGVTDDGEGGDIFNSSISDSLPTLPFEVLKKLYDATPLSTDDGRLLRRLSINTGVVHLLLACLGIFTHQSNGNGEKDGQGSKSKEDRSQHYWAKGTGFGTGSTQQSWNVEQALMKQKNEEEHVTVLLQVLASYVNPNDEAEDELCENVLPQPFYELLMQSALLPAVCSYLRNDSVLDMARHIPLYRAVLQLLRALAVSSQLVSLLLPQKNKGSDPSVCSLLRNMKSCVDTYASKLRMNTKSKLKSKQGEQAEDLEQGEGLATLMPDIQNTANLVSRVTSGLVDSDSSCDSENSVDKKVVVSLEEQYLRIMKNLQFSSHEMIAELPEGGIKFVVSHHFESNAKSTSEQSHPARVKRIAQEAVTLSTSLPLSYSSSVFVRYDTSRLDVMKVLITGPSDTPYANGCFELDVFFPPDYPLSPMMINLETTGHHTVRFNPNLYNDGKVCLSVLNTWHGRPEEKWNAATSSFLQVLVSIQSLILVSEPYFNEPGYERARGTPAGTVSSREYNLNICQATVRWAMLEQILNPCPCFKDIIHTHFYIKRHEILAQVEKWIAEVEQEVTKEKKLTRSSKKSPASTLDTFKKVYQQLKDALMKLRPPPELEEEDEELPLTPTNNMEVAIEVHQADTDRDMEKMVDDMCE